MDTHVDRGLRSTQIFPFYTTTWYYRMSSDWTSLYTNQLADSETHMTIEGCTSTSTWYTNKYSKHPDLTNSCEQTDSSLPFRFQRIRALFFHDEVSSDAHSKELFSAIHRRSILFHHGGNC